MNYSLSDQERASGTLPADVIEAIVQDVRSNGYAVVGNVVSPESRSLLTGSVLEDVERVRATGKPTPHEDNTGEGHLQLGLRRYGPYVRSDLVANPVIESVVAAVLGEGAWLGFYNGNVNCPGSTYQPLHFDRPYSWKTPQDAQRDGQSWPPPTTTLSCSIALEEITEANGATEIYPRSHLETDVVNWDKNWVEPYPDFIEKWGPAARMPIPAGGVCFRDPRMWHRGVPNRASKPRAMIAATYHSGKCKHWRGLYIQDLDPQTLARCEADPTLRVMDDGGLGDGRLVFQSDVRGLFEAAPNRFGIDRNVRFIDAPDRVNHFHDCHLLGGARVVRGEISPEG
jgi:ectoine hydroxylase-related dioxygenase (phytanoyl-CoA dioxygenase family)